MAIFYCFVSSSAMNIYLINFMTSFFMAFEKGDSKLRSVSLLEMYIIDNKRLYNYR